MEFRDKLISIVVPVFNESGNVEQLHKEIADVITENNLNAEIIFIDDGSTDDTVEKIKKLRPLKSIIFRRNFGQTAAIDAGIKASKGDAIILMDGDLQNDPADIPLLLEKLSEGHDIVSGWRKDRKDPLSKKILSRGADKLRKFLINDEIKDSGCTLKAYRTECFDGINLYGEMHRFIVALLRIKGFKVAEVVVNHRPRVAGETKYNYKRLVKGSIDLISIWFWRKYANRPLHLFGGVGMIFGFLGSAVLFWMFVERFFFSIPIGGRIWPLIGVFFVVLGIQFFASGLLVDVAVKTYYQAKRENVYSVKDIIEND